MIRRSRRTWVGTGALVIVAAGFVVFFVIGSGESHKTAVPQSAVVTVSSPLSRQGVDRIEAIEVVDVPTVKRLAGFFPNFDAQPKSDLAGGWIVGYRIYFNYGPAQTISVTVSENNNADTWTTGQGDFAVKGNFPAFVDELRRRANSVVE